MPRVRADVGINGGKIAIGKIRETPKRSSTLRATSFLRFH
jgi:hypothetical protein